MKCPVCCLHNFDILNKYNVNAETPNVAANSSAYILVCRVLRADHGKV